MSKRTIWAIGAAFVVLAVILAALYLPPQEICEPTAQVGQEQCATYCFPLFLAIQVGEFLDRHNGLIIAVFTATLWFSTHRLWKASTKQLTHSEDTAKRELRAYLTIEPCGIKKPRGLDYHGRLGFWENSQARVAIPNNTTTPTKPPKRRRLLGMDLSLPVAEFVSFWANWTLLGALILGVVATYAIVVSGNAKERHWAEGAEKLRLQVAQAQLALEQYRSGRTLTDGQRDRLEGVLKAGPKGPVIIKPNFLSAEPTRYANALSAVFNAAGYDNVGDRPLEIVSTNKPGIFVVIKDPNVQPPQLRSIAAAFQLAGIPFSAHAEPYVPDTKSVVILVGERP